MLDRVACSSEASRCDEIPGVVGSNVVYGGNYDLKKNDVE